jgi:predicted MFS family arabinose efflux permease
MPVALVIAVGFVVLFVGGGARFAIGLIFKPMVEELGWARGELGLAVGVYFVVSAFATFVAGRLADRMDARALLAAGTLLGGVGIGLMGLVAAPWHAVLLYGVIFAVGNGTASLTTVGVMVTRSVPRRAGLANAAVISGTSFGQLVMIAALAAALAGIGWRAVFVWLAAAHLLVLPLLARALPGARPPAAASAQDGALSLGAATRAPRFWLLVVMYAICGLDDFFVATHVVAFAQDRGVGALFAGNLLALMGLTALVGVLTAGALSDRTGPALGAAIAFAARIAVFGLVALDQSPLSIAIFALVFGASFLVTAPLTVLFVRESFGTRHLGALTGLVTMVHQIFGGIGAYAGALVFDYRGSYDAAFIALLFASTIGFVLALLLRTPKSAPTSSASSGSSP